MKHTLPNLLLGLGLFSTLTFQPSTAFAQSTAFTYQGRLADGSVPATGIYDLRFTLYDAGTNGNVVAGPLTNAPVGVTNGLFQVTLDFGAGVFDGSGRWLEIGVRTNGGGAYAALLPRQAIASTPYALRAASAATVASGGVGSAALQAGAVASSSIADGTITAADLSPAVASNTFWRLTGNAGTAPGTHFIGTADNQALELRANNARVLRFEPQASSPNVIGGFPGNFVAGGAVGAVIAGGGSSGNTNRVTGSYSTVGGGYNNAATLGSATVAGGDNNLAAQDRATVGGGYNNRAVGLLSTVAGGDSNVASNSYSTVAGGSLNFAGGSYSFAAGRRAKATNQGAFVWADSQGTDFGSTSNNQYLIRAAGGVGINLNNPAAALDVNGRVKMTQLQLGTSATAGHLLTADSAGVGAWQAPGFVLRAGDTMTGSLTLASPAGLNFGNTTRQMINLFNTAYGIGVQNSTLYLRSDDGFAWFRDGVHASNSGDPGTGGTNLMSLSGNGDLYVNASVTVDTPSANTGSIFPGLAFGWATGEGIASARAVGAVNRYGIDFYTASQKRLSIANNGDIGIGTATPTDARLDLEGNLRMNDYDIHLRGNSDRNHGLGYRASVSGQGVDGPFVYGFNGGALGASGPDSITLKWDYTGNVWVSNNLSVASLTVRDAQNGASISLNGSNGEATVKVLTITGGSDLAEPFEMPADVPRGALVVIDDDRPGQLRLSDRSYDTRVAGIVSGANGVQPGLTLRQEGVLEGSQRVALTGRVYALADATRYPIRPGDLLTTSDTPGHAMKVTEHTRAPGAVIGKAMSALKDGKGYVLVLVSLQ